MQNFVTTYILQLRNFTEIFPSIFAIIHLSLKFKKYFFQQICSVVCPQNALLITRCFIILDMFGFFILLCRLLHNLSSSFLWFFCCFFFFVCWSLLLVIFQIIEKISFFMLFVDVWNKFITNLYVCMFEQFWGT